MKSALVASALLLLGALAPTLSSASNSLEKQLAFLLGNWVGTGSGEPGPGAGWFSFAPDLQGQVLARRSHSEYPAPQGRPAVVHDDLLTVYAAESEAIYLDNEGHVIHYRVSADSQAKTATFLSVEPPPSPTFRLTYRQLTANELEVVFEVSPGGESTDFKPYLSGTAVRQVQ